MSFANRIRAFFRMLFLFTILVAVAVFSAIMTIRLTIHRGVEVLPNVAGITVEQADEIAAPMGLDVVTEDKLFNATVPAEEIISQLPAPGTHIKPGQNLDVLVSLGPPQVTVPNVVGGSLRAARITAIGQGLTIGDVVAVHWVGGIGDEVVAQDPPSDAKDIHSPAVDFLVAIGPPQPAYVCPDFVGSRYTEAHAQLLKVGIQPIQEESVAAPGMLEGTIVAQTPLPGSMITPDTAFSFQVAR